MNDEIKDRSGKIKAAKARESRPGGAVDELALQNMLRKRHCKDWPNVLLQLTKRIQVVNQIWAKIMSQVMTIPGLTVSYTRDAETGNLIVSVSIKQCPDGGVPVEEKVELHEITALQLQEAAQYVEVLIMDKLDHSELLARWVEDEAKADTR